MKRQLSEVEKQAVRAQQVATDGSLRCFISGDIIGDSDVIEYDHIQPYAKDGETSTANIRIVLKEHNRRKFDQSLYDVRDNIRLERLFEAKKNNIRLQDIFELKDVEKRNTHAAQNGTLIKIDDGASAREFPLYRDAILNVQYFYGTLTYYAFPDIHWQKIRTNNPLEIRRRTRVVGAFPDGQSCLNLAAARLRYIVGTAWSTKCYMNMRPLYQPQLMQTEAVA
jgi:hypothetical protein